MRYEDKLREAFAPMHRCEACGLINDHRDDCSIHKLLDDIEHELAGKPRELPLPAPDPTPPPMAVVVKPGFLAPRYVDVRPRWVQALARWLRCRLRDLGLYQ